MSLYIKKIFNENRFFKGIYEKNNKEYFSYFKIKENDEAINILTNEILKIQNFKVINHSFDLKEYKIYRKIYLKYKTDDIFINEDVETQILNYNYSNILRFFNLKNYKLIFEKNIEKQILENVISILQKYSQKYIGISESFEYAKQLKNAPTIYDALCFIPYDFCYYNKHWWIDILRELYHEKHTTIYSFSIKNIKLYNDYGLNIFETYADDDNFKNKIIQRVELIEHQQKEKHINYCVEKITNRINEAMVHLDNEYESAKKLNDEDLIFEINVIKEELQKILNKRFEIDYFTDVCNWWPELLYPVEKNIPFFTLERKHMDKLLHIMHFKPKYL
jgi:hypothetical protein